MEQCIAYCNGKLESKKIVAFLGEVDFDIINNIIKSIISSDPKILIKSRIIRSSMTFNISPKQINHEREILLFLPG